MEKYYFKTVGEIRKSCKERCMVKDNGTMIGSVRCQECENCIEHEKPQEFTGDVDWIKCKVINDARGI